ncbi:Rubredoxin [uncultured Candidatus Thioglobus sp.]|nr:Rubredoxin [uncultured Candidatus Thioglobus sp.]
MKTYKCEVCGWIYDEALGSPKEGIEPGTKWKDVAEDWVCPDCGVTKDQFEMVEI